MDIKTWDLESCDSLVITDSGMMGGWMVVFLYMMVTDENILNVNILNSLTHLTSCHFQCFFIVTLCCLWVTQVLKKKKVFKPKKVWIHTDTSVFDRV